MHHSFLRLSFDILMVTLLQAPVTTFFWLFLGPEEAFVFVLASIVTLALINHCVNVFHRIFTTTFIALIWMLSTIVQLSVFDNAGSIMLTIIGTFVIAYTSLLCSIGVLHGMGLDAKIPFILKLENAKGRGSKFYLKAFTLSLVIAISNALGLIHEDIFGILSQPDEKEVLLAIFSSQIGFALVVLTACYALMLGFGPIFVYIPSKLIGEWCKSPTEQLEGIFLDVKQYLGIERAPVGLFISGYLINGGWFGLCYLLADRLISGGVFKENIHQVVDYFYFSFMTISTVGAGEMAPSHVALKLLVMAQVLIAAIWIAVIFQIFLKHRNEGQTADSVSIGVSSFKVTTKRGRTGTIREIFEGTKIRRTD